MENNILKPTCENKGGRVLFYLFEIAALVVGALYFLFGLVDAIQYSSFGAFASGLLTGVVYLLLLYGVGRIIDLLYHKNEK